MSTIAGRIQQRLDELKISQAELARRARLAQSTINALMTGRSRSSAHLHVIARILGVSTAWLAGESADVAAVSDLAPEQLAEQLDAVMIAEVSVASFGGGKSVLTVVGHVPVSRDWLRACVASSDESKLFVARRAGDSMAPTIADEDLVLIDGAETVVREQDRIWALGFAGVGMIKRVRVLADGTFQLLSDNPGVAPIECKASDVEIIGRVAAVTRRL